MSRMNTTKIRINYRELLYFPLKLDRSLKHTNVENIEYQVTAVRDRKAVGKVSFDPKLVDISALPLSFK